MFRIHIHRIQIQTSGPNKNLTVISLILWFQRPRKRLQLFWDKTFGSWLVRFKPFLEVFFPFFMEFFAFLDSQHRRTVAGKVWNFSLFHPARQLPYYIQRHTFPYKQSCELLASWCKLTDGGETWTPGDVDLLQVPVDLQHAWLQHEPLVQASVQT
jgi:hypothetical protein